jgi:NAD(P)-dependent dehydrogenase (short-subunit alcohol dehydrogenase family)
MTGHVVITGASAGVGRATAAAFGAEGWRVTLLAREPTRLEAAAAEVEREGGKSLAVPTDVADADAVEAAAAKAEQTHGDIDVWVNSAMVTVYSPVADITPEEYRRVTEVTYLGQVYGAMSALRRMRPRNRGTIVNVSSALAYHGLPLQAAYCGAKFAARGFTESLRSELLHENSGVRVSLVVLPAVNTPQFDWARNKMPHRPRPVPPVFQPEPVAAAIREAARTAPRELVLGFSSLKLMAGSMAAPGVVDRILAEQGPAGQQDEHPARERPDNLFEAVPGDFGAHGRFDDEAKWSLDPVRMGNVRVAAAGVGAAIFAGMAAAAYAAGRQTAGPQQEVRS